MLDFISPYVSPIDNSQSKALVFQEPRIREWVMRVALLRNRSGFILIDTVGLRVVKKNSRAILSRDDVCSITDPCHVPFAFRQTSAYHANPLV